MGSALGSWVVACGDDDGGGGGGVDNVAACQSLEDSLSECSAIYDGVLMCDNYANTTCDVADYFSCIEDSYGQCVDGDFPDLDAEAALDCVPLASCD